MFCSNDSNIHFKIVQCNGLDIWNYETAKSLEIRALMFKLSLGYQKYFLLSNIILFPVLAVTHFAYLHFWLLSEIFKNEVKYILCLTTPIDIVLLAVTFTSKKLGKFIIIMFWIDLVELKTIANGIKISHLSFGFENVLELCRSFVGLCNN